MSSIPTATFPEAQALFQAVNAFSMIDEVARESTTQTQVNGAHSTDASVYMKTSG